MSFFRTRPGLLLPMAVLAAGWVTIVRAQAPQGALPLYPPSERGASVTPAFEGWYQNSDGSFTFLVGYYNRNSKQTLEIPVGPNNKVEPGPLDQGQPTFFESGRQWGVFTIKVPKDFGAKVITWTLIVNGEKQSVPLTLNKGYPIAPFKELGMGNQPPSLSFVANGPKFTGPPVGIAASLTGGVGQPLPLNVWAEDAKAPAEAGRGSVTVASLSFHKFRGPGSITFDKVRISVPKQGEMVTANATFSAAGEYIVRVQANDESGEGGGGFQCCWTNAHVKVTIQ
jgi:hypothetical protein